MGLRFAGKAIPWSGDVGIPDQRIREDSASLVAFAERLKAGLLRECEMGENLGASRSTVPLALVALKHCTVPLA